MIRKNKSAYGVRGPDMNQIVLPKWSARLVNPNSKKLELAPAPTRFSPGWVISAGSVATGNSSWPVVFLGDVEFTLGQRDFGIQLFLANDLVSAVRLIRAQLRQPDGAREEIGEL